MSEVRALVVEDDPDMQALVRAQLTAMEHLCEVAADVEDAKARLLARDFRFRYVILDLGIPGGEGDPADEAMGAILRRWIRTHRGPAELPIIVHTALGEDHTLAVQAIREGANDFVKKGEPLAEAIQRVVKPPQPGRAARPTQPASGRDGETDHRVRFTGAKLRGRYVIAIDGVDQRFTKLHFQVLLALAEGCRAPGSGWIHADQFPTRHAMAAFSRLKTELAQLGLDELVSSDSAGGYRLTCRPEQVTDDPALTENLARWFKKTPRPAATGRRRR